MRTLLICLCLALVSPWAQAERLKDIASIAGIPSNQLIGYALVVALAGSGGQTRQTPITVPTCNNMLTEFGNTVPPGPRSQMKNVAAVASHAELPPCASPGQTVGITVTSIGNAKSLRGGSLLMTPLK